MMHFFSVLDSFLSNKTFLLGLTSASIVLKSIILGMLAKQPKKTFTPARILLIMVLVCANIADFPWVVCLINDLYMPSMDYRLRIFSVRIGWAFDALFYLSLSLFTSILVQRKQRYYKHQLLLTVWYMFFFASFIYLAIFKISCASPYDKSEFECIIQSIYTYSTILILMSVIIFNFWQIYQTSLPRILNKQLRIFVCVILSSFLFSIVLQTTSSLTPNFVTNSYAAVGLCNIITTFAVFFCARKFMGLRFLNMGSKVHAKTRFNFMDGFKNILEQLGQATSIKEILYVTQACMRQMFQIPPSRVRFYAREITADLKEPLSPCETIVENFLLLQPKLIEEYITTHKVLVYDEIEFTNFYENDPDASIILNFLDSINADIFIPVMVKEKMLGYIIIDRFSRPRDLYSSVEYDEMVVYASYLGNSIHLMQTHNLDLVIAREKELQEELYHKHQEINQYKESIYSFLRNQKHKEIGIIFYKNRRFTYGNQAAKELIDININTQQGHPITSKMKDLARKVQEYKSPQTCFIKDKQGQKIVLSAVPHLEQNAVIITAYYPEISDLVKKQLELLKDPTNWDYLLYLETTESGKLINQLIPGSGEQLLQFKITLLQSALSKKATLLDMPEDDLITTATLLHHISLRQTLHTVKLTSPTHSNDIAAKLFGINPIFGLPQEGKPLFEKLDNTGTLFIQNIHFLDMETQNYLAEYLIYGTYRAFKSDQKKHANVRIICSTNKDLQTLIQEGLFNQDLFNHLQKHTVTMPSLLTLPEHEIHQLAEGYTEQALITHDFKNLLELTHKEKHKIAAQRPASLHDLKTKIHQLLVTKSKNNHIYTETHFDPAYETNDPELIEAARLGKHALRDQKILTLLWNKFQSQSKIASFLGVNRSSVNRRCQKYNLS